MKRFVTYLYECERGNQSKNIGFIRVHVHEEETKMEIYIRNYLQKDKEGEMYALVHNGHLIGIPLGKIKIKDGQCDCFLEVATKNINDSGFSLHDIVGIGMRVDGGGYIVSCWNDQWNGEIILGDFNVREEGSLVAAEEKKEEIMVTYEKIDLAQIRALKSPNWHLSTNSFLLHGFWNYGYLVLKKKLEEGKETHSLGVCGFFEKQEAVMAILFGFETFEELDKKIVNMNMNQACVFSEASKEGDFETGTFGAWFVELKK